MKDQNYTVLKMFETGDDFYATMGLFRVPDTFWELGGDIPEARFCTNK